MVRGAREAFDRYLRKRFGDKAADRGAVEEVAAELEPMDSLVKVLATHTYGMSMVFEGIWKDLGLKGGFDALAASTQCTFPVERAAHTMCF